MHWEATAASARGARARRAPVPARAPASAPRARARLQWWAVQKKIVFMKTKKFKFLRSRRSVFLAPPTHGANIRFEVTVGKLWIESIMAGQPSAGLRQGTVWVSFAGGLLLLGLLASRTSPGAAPSPPRRLATARAPAPALAGGGGDEMVSNVSDSPRTYILHSWRRNGKPCGGG